LQETLLQKSRGINKILQKIRGNPVDFYGIADVISKSLNCTVFIVGRRGQISGYAFSSDAPCTQMTGLLEHAERFPESYNQEFNSITETKANLTINDGRRCLFDPDGLECDCSKHIWSITPVFGGATRMGTLILVKAENYFSEEDILLAEYGAIVVANEIMRMRSERIEETTRKKASVQVALATLSYSEREAIDHIMAELQGKKEGLVVASRVADKAGITRSVIVSAVRKVESAGVIESRSLGMKGTYIRILNDYLLDELNK